MWINGKARNNWSIKVVFCFKTLIVLMALLLTPTPSFAACSRDGDYGFCDTEGEAIAYAIEESNSCGILCGCTYFLEEANKHIYFGAYIYTGDLAHYDPNACSQQTWAYTYFHITWANPCTNDPCCMSTDPCCGSSDPCCDDPCCGKECCDQGGSGGGPLSTSGM